MKLDYQKDGVDHINSYSKAKTLLGRRLSNFDSFPITIEGLTFRGIEPYWYYLGLDNLSQADLTTLLESSGTESKILGRKFRRVYGNYYKDPLFLDKINAATRLKITSDPALLKLYSENSLPIVHYYLKTNPHYQQKKIIVPNYTNEPQIHYMNVVLREELGLEPINYQTAYKMSEPLLF